MNFRSEQKVNLPRSLMALLAVVFLVWTAGAHALPVYEDASASSLLVDGQGLSDASSDGSSPTEDAPLKRFETDSSSLELTSCALLHLAFAGPRLRLLSYPGLSQAPPFTL